MWRHMHIASEGFTRLFKGQCFSRALSTGTDRTISAWEVAGRARGKLNPAKCFNDLPAISCKVPRSGICHIDQPERRKDLEWPPCHVIET
jgi:hypothetical protein